MSTLGLLGMVICSTPRGQHLALDPVIHVRSVIIGALPDSKTPGTTSFTGPAFEGLVVQTQIVRKFWSSWDPRRRAGRERKSRVLGMREITNAKTVWKG